MHFFYHGVKPIILFLILVVVSLIFLSGIFVGHYQLFPFQVLQELKKSLTPPIPPDFQNETVSISFPIHVENMEDVIHLRNELIKYIWVDENYPLIKYPETTFDIVDSRYDELPNLKKINKLEHKMEYGVNSIIYHFIPEESNNELIIYHEGHGGDFYLGKDTIAYFLESGYSVLAFSMPLVGMNDSPKYDDPRLGLINLKKHSDFAFLESSDFHTAKFFFEPLTVSLNYIDLEYDYDDYYMIGISGGGWTAVVFPAIDTRIKESYSVSGSVPFIFRNTDKNYGDYEQRLVEMYQIANYFDLYLMASMGENRKFVQIFNKFDPCCFAGDYRLYEDDLQKIVNTNGKFEMLIDETHKEHKISDFTLNYIKNSIEYK